MRWLAPQLPLPVPVPETTTAGYGIGCWSVCSWRTTTPVRPIGRDLGCFLQALHQVDPAEAVARGALDGTSAASELSVLLEKGQYITGACRSRAGHLPIRDRAVAGVIDWTDAHIGDPKLDLSWLLNHAPTTMAEGRALDWHRLGPWHEVWHGLVTRQPDYVQSGIVGVLDRL
jgi:hypothetical protein